MSSDENSAMPTPPSEAFIVGIDLGTTNSALAYLRPGAEAQTPTVLGVEQLAGAGMVQTQTSLPSFLYIPVPGELTPESARLPWDEAGQTDAVLGSWARDRGTLIPERLVVSAKSWLGNSHADRQAPILPWRSDVAAGKVSPVEASTRYLRHLAASFHHHVPEARAMDVVLTVPASFDEVARGLTYEAASRAGLAQGKLTLLEEPQAAFYAWLSAVGDNWREFVQPGDVVLICDVGGGTTDFSLIAVTDQGGTLGLERVAVGDHLLLGGDNMDLTLAMVLKQGLEAQGHTLDHWQFLSLVGAARDAKEKLLADAALAEVPIAVASRGASLFAGTLSTQLTRAQVEQVILAGFFPLTGVDELPAARRSVGFQEFGLTYETDAAISRHLARFLKRARQNIESNPELARLVADRLRPGESHLMPTAVLFNGGVFKAPVLRTQVKNLLQAWNGGEAVQELVGAELDLAVALGAAYYGRLRATGKGIRVASGTARSYYVGLESPAPAIPGFEPPVKGLCLVPQGTDEGTEIEFKEQQFGLLVGEPVEFRFFSSSVRAGDAVGTVVPDAVRDLDETSRLSVTLPSEGRRAGEIVPVRLDAVVTETGTLQLFMKDAVTDRKWHLEFNVRAHDHV